jgi:hypothetical protein
MSVVHNIGKTEGPPPSRLISQLARHVHDGLPKRAESDDARGPCLVASRVTGGRNEGYRRYPFPRNSATTASQVSATSRIPWEVWRSVIEAARRRQRSASASSRSIIPSVGIDSSGTLPLQQAAAILSSSTPHAASLLTERSRRRGNQRAVRRLYGAERAEVGQP